MQKPLPTHLIPSEPEGADFDAFRAQKKFNSAHEFDDRVEGRTALAKVAPAYFNAVAKALKVKPGSESK